MPDLAGTRPPPVTRELLWMRTLVGALLGALLWLEIIALGVPKVLWGSPGYNLIPVATLAGALLGRTRVRHALLATTTGVAILIAVIAYTPIMRRLTRASVRADATGPAVQAIVVLSGGITSDGHLEPAAADRLLTGLSLVRRGVASTLIVSRERPRDHRRGLTSDLDQQRLVALLDRPVRLLIADSVYSTRDEAVRMRALAQALGISSVAVVTSPVHTRRACATFERVGFAVTCVPSESRGVPLGNLRVATDRVQAFQLWLYELAGRTLYRARGWI
ncbi:MAG: YdcF family protein [Gemmatimonadaceae bacterium]